MPTDQLVKKLVEIAGSYKEALARAAPNPSDPPEIAKVKEAVNDWKITDLFGLLLQAITTLETTIHEARKVLDPEIAKFLNFARWKSNFLTQRAPFRTNALDTPYRPGGSSPRAGWDATMDIGGWLRGLGLGQYEATFRESEIDAEVLPELTESDLSQLGVPLGHRKRLLKAIAALGAAEKRTGGASGPRREDAVSHGANAASSP